ncbi:hypothetical protein CISG_04273 [Coccidioides immitis RMSCC 3703]|uniref:Uncharacterized protein n=1 Tax=Coccidioides immitis RMSCC 3703 TaxID=454286 RepID=A0A0J8QQ63_COCIT|nr:hypothetical protein CISG_04273 [Coccidioides immitis RMSCC 3703]
MVLDYDQPSQSASGFGDDAPMSDSDPYFSSQKGPHSLFAKFPTNISLPPFTFGRRLLHWTQSNYETKLSMIIRAQMDTASAMVNRFPSQEETDAIVEQASMLFDIPEAAGLAGGSLGLYLGGKPTNFDPKDAEVQQSSQQPQYYRPSQPSQGQSFWDDDASPTNPEVDATPQTSSASAWERIRQSAATQSSSNNRGFAARRPPQQEQQQQQQSQQPSSGDDWRSSDYGAGRDYGDKYAQSSREQAQRDFDKLIDREREFGSDKERDSGSAWGKRW